MAELNQLICDETRAYVGKTKCPTSPAAFIGCILGPLDRVLSPAELLTLQTTIQDAAIDNTLADRLYPITSFKAVEDGSEEPERFTYQDRSSIITNPANYRWTFSYEEGICFLQNLKALNGSHGEFGVIMVDKLNQFWGTKKRDGSNALGLGFVEMSDFYVDNWKAATFTDPVNNRLTIEIADPSQLNENVAFVKADFSLRTIKAIQAVELGLISFVSGTNGTIQVQAYSGCSGLNLANEFGTALAVTGAWVVTNTATGAAITITSVTALANGQGWLLDLDQTDTDYPATSAQLDIKLASVSALSALGVKYYESDTLTVTRPA